MRREITVILLLGLCAVACKKAKNKRYEFNRNDFDGIEIGGVKSQPNTDFVEGTSDWFKSGTPVTLTYQTPCGPKTLTFPFVLEPTQVNNDSLSMSPPIGQNSRPLEATLLLDPTLQGDIKFADRTFSVKQNIADVARYSRDPYDAKMVLRDPACAGGKADMGGKSVAIPPLPWPDDKLHGDGVKLALFAGQPDACYELRQYNYGTTAAGWSPLAALRGASLYWVRFKIDFLLLKDVPASVGKPAYDSVTSRVALERVDCTPAPESKAHGSPT